MSRRRGKTANILKHYRDRANEDVPIAEAAAACGVDSKIASTLAARLAKEGTLTRVRRGVYSLETGQPESQTTELVVNELLVAVGRAFGPSRAEAIEERVGPARDTEALSAAFREVASLVGDAGGERILRGVLASLPRSEAGAVLKALGVR